METGSIFGKFLYLGNKKWSTSIDNRYTATLARESAHQSLYASARVLELFTVADFLKISDLIVSWPIRTGISLIFTSRRISVAFWNSLRPSRIRSEDTHLCESAIAFDSSGVPFSFPTLLGIQMGRFQRARIYIRGRDARSRQFRMRPLERAAALSLATYFFIVSMLRSLKCHYSIGVGVSFLTRATFGVSK